MQKFEKNECLVNKLGSWLGVGHRESLTENDVISLFGEDKLESFANGLHVSRQNLVMALAEMLPAIIRRYLLTDPYGAIQVEINWQ